MFKRASVPYPLLMFVVRLFIYFTDFDDNVKQDYIFIVPSIIMIHRTLQGSGAAVVAVGAGSPRL